MELPRVRATHSLIIKSYTSPILINQDSDEIKVKLLRTLPIFFCGFSILIFLVSRSIFRFSSLIKSTSSILLKVNQVELGKATKSIFTIPAQFQPQLQLQPQAVNVSSHLSANTGTELP